MGSVVQACASMSIALYCVVTTDIFKTDTEISRANGSGYGKELQVGVELVGECGVESQ